MVTLAAKSCDISPVDNPDNSQGELQALTSYFELLSQIDERLQKEDSEYRMRYYPES